MERVKAAAIFFGFLGFFLQIQAISLPFLSDASIQSSQQGKKPEIGLDPSEFAENEENASIDSPKFSLLSALPPLSGINLPSHPNFLSINIQNLFPRRPPIRATKTEYFEITRRQTIHPVCYTSLKKKSTCLPLYRDGSIENQTQQEIDYGMSVQIETETVPQTEDEEVLVSKTSDHARDPKYLEFATHAKAPHTEIESSMSPQEARYPFQRNTEWVTKTVLVTRVERFTDHRVTATLIAKNCIPVNPNIPKCHRHSSIIVDTPDHLFGETSDNVPIIIASAVASADTNKIAAAMEAIDQAAQAFSDKKLSQLPIVLKEPIAEVDTDGETEEAEGSLDIDDEK